MFMERFRAHPPHARRYTNGIFCHRNGQRECKRHSSGMAGRLAPTYGRAPRRAARRVRRGRRMPIILLESSGLHAIRTNPVSRYADAPLTTSTAIRPTPTACWRPPRSSRAPRARGVDVLALTDHDEVAGSPRRRAPPRRRGITLVCGSELSVELGGPHDPRRRARIDPDERDARRRPRRDPRGPDVARAADRRRAGRGRHPRRVRRRDAIRDQRAARLAHAFRALPGRSRPRARHEGRLQALPDARQARARRARVGDAVARRSAGSTRPADRRCIAHPGRYKVDAARHAAAARRVPRRRRRRDRSAVAVAHAGAVRGVRDAMRACSGSRAPAAPTSTVPARAGWTWATCRDCPRASCPVWKDW